MLPLCEKASNPGNVQFYIVTTWETPGISRGRLAWWLVVFLHSAHFCSRESCEFFQAIYKYVVNTKRFHCIGQGVRSTTHTIQASRLTVVHEFCKIAFCSEVDKLLFKPIIPVSTLMNIRCHSMTGLVENIVPMHPMKTLKVM